MANVQLENGYSRIANEILENIVKLPLNGTQLRIIMVIWRNTYGFSRKEAEISGSYLARAINVDRRTIRREITDLINNRILIVVREADFTNSRVIKFNKNYDEWVRVIKPPGDSKPSEGELATTPEGELAPSPEGELAPQKRNIIKKELKKDICPFSEIIDLYNGICLSLAKVQKVTDSRKRKLTARWKDMPNIDQWKQLFNEIEKTPFLKGENDRGWKVSFDWLIENDSNIAKIQEGQYRRVKSKPEENKTWGWRP